MSNKDKINRLPILDVLSKLWYYKWTHYILQWKNIRMKDSAGKISDWWIGDIVKNKMFAKSWLKEWRFEWDILWIIKWARNCEVSEAFKWAEEAFDIKNDITPSDVNKMQEKWNKLDSLSPVQISYLWDRHIEYNEHLKRVVKDNSWPIAITINSEWWNIKAIQSRKIEKNVDKKFRYQIEKEWEDGSGIFTYFWNKESKVCFVVEGMTDFLTMVQFWVNVIWLVSATTWMQYLKAFHKRYELIYIPDNDEWGEDSVAALDNAEIRYGKYSLKDWYWDLNDFWCTLSEIWLSKNDFLKEIYEEADKPLDNIWLALRKAIRNRDIGSFLVWDKVFDDATWGVTPWSVMIINWLSWEGKTTTLDWIITSLMRHEKKMAFCSIDDDIGKMLWMFLWRHFHKDWKEEIYPNIEEYVREYWTEKFKNFLLYDDMNTLEQFSQIVEDEKIDVLIIDYIQVIEWLQWKDMQAKMLQAIRGLQRLSIDTHTAIICLSQVSKWEDQKPVLYRTPMESQYIKSAADTFINVGKYNWAHKIAFVKNKYWKSKYKNSEHDTYWDMKTWKISIFPAEFADENQDSRKI